jgi:hypothetical protein
MDQKALSESIENKLSELFDELMSGISEREDSRAFGAMIEKRITTSWNTICSDLGYKALPQPGRRTIYDFGLVAKNQLVGIDVKTKDLDSTKYSDGGICAVGNLLKYLANDKGLFLICEFGHNRASEKSEARDIEYIKVCPFVMLPKDAYRIENLGTGQVRLNYTINQVWDEIDWGRDSNEFYDLFIDLAIQHYRRVSKDAIHRIASLEAFRKRGYETFSFKR